MNKYMTLDELKTRLRIDNNDDDDYLQELLDDVVEFVLEWTNNSFGGKFPRDVKRAISRLVALEVKADGAIGGVGSSTDEDKEVKTVKIDGLSETYVTSTEKADGELSAWDKYMNMAGSPFAVLRLYRKVKFRGTGRTRNCRG